MEEEGTKSKESSKVISDDFETLENEGTKSKESSKVISDNVIEDDEEDDYDNDGLSPPNSGRRK